MSSGGEGSRQDLLINLAAAAEKQDQFDVNDTTIFIIDFIAAASLSHSKTTTH